MPTLQGNPHEFVRTTFGTLFTPDDGVVEVVQRHVDELVKLGFTLKDGESSTPTPKPTEGEVSKSATAVVESTQELAAPSTKRVLSAETTRETKG